VFLRHCLAQHSGYIRSLSQKDITGPTIQIQKSAKANHLRNSFQQLSQTQPASIASNISTLIQGVNMSATNGIDTFADFDVDPTSSIVAAFDCLAIQNEWEKKSADYKDNRVRLVTNEFGIQFGYNWSHLGGWQALCSAVGIAEVPSSITQCKKVTKQKIDILYGSF
jgi:hypothetical protein